MFGQKSRNYFFSFGSLLGVFVGGVVSVVLILPSNACSRTAVFPYSIVNKIYAQGKCVELTPAERAEKEAEAEVTRVQNAQRQAELFAEAPVKAIKIVSENGYVASEFRVNHPLIYWASKIVDSVLFGGVVLLLGALAYTTGSIVMSVSMPLALGAMLFMFPVYVSMFASAIGVYTGTPRVGDLVNSLKKVNQYLNVTELLAYRLMSGIDNGSYTINPLRSTSFGEAPVPLPTMQDPVVSTARVEDAYISLYQHTETDRGKKKEVEHQLAQALQTLHIEKSIGDAEVLDPDRLITRSVYYGWKTMFLDTSLYGKKLQQMFFQIRAGFHGIVGVTNNRIQTRVGVMTDLLRDVQDVDIAKEATRLISEYGLTPSEAQFAVRLATKLSILYRDTGLYVEVTHTDDSIQNSAFSRLERPNPDNAAKRSKDILEYALAKDNDAVRKLVLEGEQLPMPLTSVIWKVVQEVAREDIEGTSYYNYDVYKEEVNSVPSLVAGLDAAAVVRYPGIRLFSGLKQNPILSYIFEQFQRKTTDDALEKPFDVSSINNDFDATNDYFESSDGKALVGAMRDSEAFEKTIVDDAVSKIQAVAEEVYDVLSNEIREQGQKGIERADDFLVALETMPEKYPPNGQTAESVSLAKSFVEQLGLKHLPKTLLLLLQKHLVADAGHAQNIVIDPIWDRIDFAKSTISKKDQEELKKTADANAKPHAMLASFTQYIYLNILGYKIVGRYDFTSLDAANRTRLGMVGGDMILRIGSRAMKEALQKECTGCEIVRAGISGDEYIILAPPSLTRDRDSFEGVVSRIKTNIFSEGGENNSPRYFVAPDRWLYQNGTTMEMRNVRVKYTEEPFYSERLFAKSETDQSHTLPEVTREEYEEFKRRGYPEAEETIALIDADEKLLQEGRYVRGHMDANAIYQAKQVLLAAYSDNLVDTVVQELRFGPDDPHIITTRSLDTFQRRMRLLKEGEVLTYRRGLEFYIALAGSAGSVNVILVDTPGALKTTQETEGYIAGDALISTVVRSALSQLRGKKQLTMQEDVNKVVETIRNVLELHPPVLIGNKTVTLHSGVAYDHASSRRAWAERRIEALKSKTTDNHLFNLRERWNDNNASVRAEVEAYAWDYYTDVKRGFGRLMIIAPDEVSALSLTSLIPEKKAEFLAGIKNTLDGYPIGKGEIPLLADAKAHAQTRVTGYVVGDIPEYPGREFYLHVPKGEIYFALENEANPLLNIGVGARMVLRIDDDPTSDIAYIKQNDGTWKLAHENDVKLVYREIQKDDTIVLAPDIGSGFAFLTRLDPRLSAYLGVFGAAARVISGQGSVNPLAAYGLAFGMEWVQKMGCTATVACNTISLLQEAAERILKWGEGSILFTLTIPEIVAYAQNRNVMVLGTDIFMNDVRLNHLLQTYLDRHPDEDTYQSTQKEKKIRSLVQEIIWRQKAAIDHVYVPPELYRDPQLKYLNNPSYLRKRVRDLVDVLMEDGTQVVLGCTELPDAFRYAAKYDDTVANYLNNTDPEKRPIDPADLVNAKLLVNRGLEWSADLISVLPEGFRFQLLMPQIETLVQEAESIHRSVQSTDITRINEIREKVDMLIMQIHPEFTNEEDIRAFKLEHGDLQQRIMGPSSGMMMKSASDISAQVGDYVAVDTSPGSIWRVVRFTGVTATLELVQKLPGIQTSNSTSVHRSRIVFLSHTPQDFTYLDIDSPMEEGKKITFVTDSNTTYVQLGNGSYAQVPRIDQGYDHLIIQDGLAVGLDKDGDVVFQESLYDTTVSVDGKDISFTTLFSGAPYDTVRREPFGALAVSDDRLHIIGYTNNQYVIISPQEDRRVNIPTQQAIRSKRIATYTYPPVVLRWPLSLAQAPLIQKTELPIRFATSDGDVMEIRSVRVVHGRLIGVGAIMYTTEEKRIALGVTETPVRIMFHLNAQDILDFAQGSKDAQHEFERRYIEANDILIAWHGYMESGEQYEPASDTVLDEWNDSGKKQMLIALSHSGTEDTYMKNPSYGPDNLVAQVKDAIEYLSGQFDLTNKDKRVVLMGHSLGGWVLNRLAQQYSSISDSVFAKAKYIAVSPYLGIKKQLILLNAYRILPWQWSGVLRIINWPLFRVIPGVRTTLLRIFDRIGFNDELFRAIVSQNDPDVLSDEAIAVSQKIPLKQIYNANVSIRMTETLLGANEIIDNDKTSLHTLSENNRLIWLYPGIDDALDSSITEEKARTMRIKSAGFRKGHNPSLLGWGGNIHDVVQKMFNDEAIGAEMTRARTVLSENFPMIERNRPHNFWRVLFRMDSKASVVPSSSTQPEPVSVAVAPPTRTTVSTSMTQTQLIVANREILKNGHMYKLGNALLLALGFGAPSEERSRLRDLLSAPIFSQQTKTSMNEVLDLFIDRMLDPEQLNELPAIPNSFDPDLAKDLEEIKQKSNLRPVWNIQSWKMMKKLGGKVIATVTLPQLESLPESGQSIDAVLAKYARATFVDLVIAKQGDPFTNFELIRTDANTYAVVSFASSKEEQTIQMLRDINISHEMIVLPPAYKAFVRQPLEVHVSLSTDVDVFEASGGEVSGDTGPLPVLTDAELTKLRTRHGTLHRILSVIEADEDVTMQQAKGAVQNLLISLATDDALDKEAVNLEADLKVKLADASVRLHSIKADALEEARAVYGSAFTVIRIDEPAALRMAQKAGGNKERAKVNVELFKRLGQYLFDTLRIKDMIIYHPTDNEYYVITGSSFPFDAARVQKELGESFRENAKPYILPNGSPLFIAPTAASVLIESDPTNPADAEEKFEEARTFLKEAITLRMRRFIRSYFVSSSSIESWKWDWLRTYLMDNPTRIKRLGSTDVVTHQSTSDDLMKIVRTRERAHDVALAKQIKKTEQNNWSSQFQFERFYRGIGNRIEKIAVFTIEKIMLTRKERIDYRPDGSIVEGFEQQMMIDAPGEKGRIVAQVSSSETTEEHRSEKMQIQMLAHHLFFALTNTEYEHQPMNVSLDSSKTPWKVVLEEKEVSVALYNAATKTWKSVSVEIDGVSSMVREYHDLQKQLLKATGDQKIQIQSELDTIKQFFMTIIVRRFVDATTTTTKPEHLIASFYQRDPNASLNVTQAPEVMVPETGAPVVYGFDDMGHPITANDHLVADGYLSVRFLQEFTNLLGVTATLEELAKMEVIRHPTDPSMDIRVLRLPNATTYEQALDAVRNATYRQGKTGVMTPVGRRGLKDRVAIAAIPSLERYTPQFINTILAGTRQGYGLLDRTSYALFTRIPPWLVRIVQWFMGLPGFSSFQDMLRGPMPTWIADTWKNGVPPVLTTIIAAKDKKTPTIAFMVDKDGTILMVMQGMANEVVREEIIRDIRDDILAAQRGVVAPWSKMKPWFIRAVVEPYREWQRKRALQRGNLTGFVPLVKIDSITSNTFVPPEQLNDWEIAPNTDSYALLSDNTSQLHIANVERDGKKTLALIVSDDEKKVIKLNGVPVKGKVQIRVGDVIEVSPRLGVFRVSIQEDTSHAIGLYDVVLVAQGKSTLSSVYRNTKVAVTTALLGHDETGELIDGNWYNDYKNVAVLALSDGLKIFDKMSRWITRRNMSIQGNELAFRVGDSEIPLIDLYSDKRLSSNFFHVLESDISYQIIDVKTKALVGFVTRHGRFLEVEFVDAVRTTDVHEDGTLRRFPQDTQLVELVVNDPEQNAWFDAQMQRLKLWWSSLGNPKNPCSGGSAGIIRRIFAQQDDVCLSLGVGDFVEQRRLIGDQPVMKPLPQKGGWFAIYPDLDRAKRAGSKEKMGIDAKKFDATHRILGIPSTWFIVLYDIDGKPLSIINTSSVMHQLHDAYAPSYEAKSITVASAGIVMEAHQDREVVHAPFDIPSSWRRTVVGTDVMYILPNNIVISLDGIHTQEGLTFEQIQAQVDARGFEIATLLESFDPSVYLSYQDRINALRVIIDPYISKVVRQQNSAKSSLSITIPYRDQFGETRMLDYQIGEQYSLYVTPKNETAGNVSLIPFHVAQMLTLDEANYVLSKQPPSSNGETIEQKFRRYFDEYGRYFAHEDEARIVFAWQFLSDEDRAAYQIVGLRNGAIVPQFVTDSESVPSVIDRATYPKARYILGTNGFYRAINTQARRELIAGMLQSAPSPEVARKQILEQLYRWGASSALVGDDLVFSIVFGNDDDVYVHTDSLENISHVQMTVAPMESDAVLERVKTTFGAVEVVVEKHSNGVMIRRTTKSKKLFINDILVDSDNISIALGDQIRGEGDEITYEVSISTNGNILLCDTRFLFFLESLMIDQDETKELPMSFPLSATRNDAVGAYTGPISNSNTTAIIQMYIQKSAPKSKKLTIAYGMRVTKPFAAKSLVREFESFAENKKDEWYIIYDDESTEIGRIRKTDGGFVEVRIPPTEEGRRVATQQPSLVQRFWSVITSGALNTRSGITSSFPNTNSFDVDDTSIERIRIDEAQDPQETIQPVTWYERLAQSVKKWWGEQGITHFAEPIQMRFWDRMGELWERLMKVVGIKKQSTNEVDQQVSNVPSTLTYEPGMNIIPLDTTYYRTYRVEYPDGRRYVIRSSGSPIWHALYTKYFFEYVLPYVDVALDERVRNEILELSKHTVDTTLLTNFTIQPEIQGVHLSHVLRGILQGVDTYDTQLLRSVYIFLIDALHAYADGFKIDAPMKFFVTPQRNEANIILQPDNSIRIVDTNNGAIKEGSNAFLYSGPLEQSILFSPFYDSDIKVLLSKIDLIDPTIGLSVARQQIPHVVTQQMILTARDQALLRDQTLEGERLVNAMIPLIEQMQEYQVLVERIPDGMNKDGLLASLQERVREELPQNLPLSSTQSVYKFLNISNIDTSLGTLATVYGSARYLQAYSDEQIRNFIQHMNTLFWGYGKYIDWTFPFWRLSDFGFGMLTMGAVSFVIRSLSVIFTKTWTPSKIISVASTVVSIYLYELFDTGFQVVKGSSDQSFVFVEQAMYYFLHPILFIQDAAINISNDPYDFIVGIVGICTPLLAEFLFNILVNKRGWSIKNGLLAVRQWIKNGRLGFVTLLISSGLVLSGVAQSAPVQKAIEMGCFTQNPFIERVYATSGEGNTCHPGLRAPWRVVAENADEIFDNTSREKQIKMITNTVRDIAGKTLEVEIRLLKLFFKLEELTRLANWMFLNFPGRTDLEEPDPYALGLVGQGCYFGTCRDGCGDGYACEEETQCCNGKEGYTDYVCSIDNNAEIERVMTISEINDSLDYFDIGDVKLCDTRGCDKNGRCAGYSTDTTGLPLCRDLEKRSVQNPVDTHVQVTGCIEGDGSVGARAGVPIEEYRLYTCSDDGMSVLDKNKKTVYSCDSGTRCALGELVHCMLPTTIEAVSLCSPHMTYSNGFRCTPEGLRCTPGQRLPKTAQNPCESVCKEDGVLTELAYPIDCNPVLSDYTDAVCHVDNTTGTNGVYMVNSATGEDFGKQRDCGTNACTRGMCVKTQGEVCDSGGEEIWAMREDGACLLECRDNRWHEANGCGHFKVNSFNNSGVVDISKALGVLPAHMFEGMDILIRNEYTSTVKSNSSPYANGLSHGYVLNRYLMVMGNTYLTDGSSVVHEFMHQWAFEHQVALESPLDKSIFLTSAIDSLGFQANVPAPKEYVTLTHCDNPSEQLPTLTDYAKTNCSEDFAVHGERYVFSACELRNKSKERYEYYRDNVFKGTEYLPAEGCEN